MDLSVILNHRKYDTWLFSCGNLPKNSYSLSINCRYKEIHSLSLSLSLDFNGDVYTEGCILGTRVNHVMTQL